MNRSLKTAYSCLIVDDYEIDRLTVLAHVRKYPFIEVAGVYDSAEKALEHLRKEPVKLLFLDIDMPGISGLELRSRFMDIPACIFITAYPDYAVDAFEAAALDFLIKPMNADRFDKAVLRIREYSLGNDIIFIKEGHDKTKVKLHDILYLEALRDYTKIVTPEKKFHVLTTLGNLLNESEFRSFIRIHRSFAVQRHYVKKLDTKTVYLDNISLPLGKTYKANIDTLFQ
jgi:two-component system LytT family response regulator